MDYLLVLEHGKDKSQECIIYSEDVTICDYIVGMTDNFTGQLYNKISAV